MTVTMSTLLISPTCRPSTLPRWRTRCFRTPLWPRPPVSSRAAKAPSSRATRRALLAAREITRTMRTRFTIRSTTSCLMTTTRTKVTMTTTSPCSIPPPTTMRDGRGAIPSPGAWTPPTERPGRPSRRCLSHPAIRGRWSGAPNRRTSGPGPLAMVPTTPPAAAWGGLHPSERRSRARAPRAIRPSHPRPPTARTCPSRTRCLRTQVVRPRSGRGPPFNPWGRGPPRAPAHPSCPRDRGGRCYPTFRSRARTCPRSRVRTTWRTTAPVAPARSSSCR
mmetsp:Transcript_8795/g.26330  ORF Transcript_8795/g.26330 Transcript_8795/m.26330 type:complete len:277 (-) Transcript_8795:2745-3575(-)